jgi:uncharacterized protein
MNNTLDIVSLVLVIAGGINWLLVGMFRFDLVAAIAGRRFGEVNWFNAMVYILVGVAAIYQAAIARKARHPVAPGQERPTRLIHR